MDPDITQRDAPVTWSAFIVSCDATRKKTGRHGGSVPLDIGIRESANTADGSTNYGPAEGSRWSSWTGNSPAEFMTGTSRVSVMICRFPRRVCMTQAPNLRVQGLMRRSAILKKALSFDLIPQGASVFNINSHSEQNHHCFCAYKWSAATMASIYKVNCCIHFSNNTKANPCIVYLEST